jgi:CRP-like cAMP-binding protein
MGCLLGETRTASVRAVTFVEMYYLEKRRLLEVIGEFPDAMEIFVKTGQGRQKILERIASQDDFKATLATGVVKGILQRDKRGGEEVRGRFEHRVACLP